jgi:outer membrane protein assembly factor BamB
MVVAQPRLMLGGTARWMASRGRAVGTSLAAAVVVLSMLGAVSGVPSGSTAFGASSQDWPMFLHDSARSAATTDANLSVANAPALKLLWNFSAGGPIATSISVVGTTAYVGAWDGYEYAVNTSNGALLWKTYLGITTDANCAPATIGITSSAAVVGGVVYVGGGGSSWYALDPTTGNILWSVPTGDNSVTGAHYNWSSPLIYNGNAYIGIASNCDNPLVQGQLMEVNLASHQVTATYNLVPNGEVGGGVWTSPTVDPATNTIFVATGTLNDYTQTQSQAIVALDATTLAYKSSWQLPFEAAVTDSDWGTTPTLSTDAGGDQLLSVANKNGTLYTFNRNNLAAGPVWQQQIAFGGACPTCGDGSISSGAFANGVLYYAGGNNEVNGHGSAGSLSAFNPGTGAVLWTRQTEQPIIGAPAYVNGMIGEVEGSTFEVLNAATGALLYSYALKAPSDGAVSVAYSRFYVGALDGRVYTFGAGTPTTPKADPNCPAGFTCQDIHNPGVAGSESTTNGALTVKAAGSDIKGTGDQFRFISQPVTGDSQESTGLVSQTAQPGQIQQAGLMMRQSTDPASPFYAVLAYPNDSPPDLQVLYRAAWGQNLVKLVVQSPVTAPVSLLAQRVGNLFSAGISTDGVTYQVIPGSTADLDLPTTTLQGLAVDSGSSSNTGTASFTGLSVGGAPTTTLAPPASAHPCPAPWTCTDVGNPTPAGDATLSGSALTLSGTGTGIGGSSDSMHYLYQSVSGNQTLSAQVVTQSGASGKAQDGLLMRAGTAPTAPMYGVTLNPGSAATILWRVHDGIKNSKTIPLPASTSPAYVEIVRYQDTRLTPPLTYFGTLTSTDGANWAPVLGSTVAIDMGAGAYLAGVGATSGTAASAVPAVFNGVAITPTTTAPPGICPTGFTCADIGTGIPTGNQIFVNGSWTMQASGNIASVYDNFRFAYENFPNDPSNSAHGDGTISARVVSQAGGGTSPKVGVMIRSGTDPQAPYYGAFVTPGGVTVRWRGIQAGSTTSVASGTGATPLWVLASRYTDTTHGVVYYSAFTSTDGVTFTYVPNSETELNLPQPLVGGIASDANSTNVSSTTTFDNVAELAGSQPPPSICPAGWSCTDIGGALPPGLDQVSSGGTWNEFGGGGDIWGTADSFHLLSQSLAGDGSVMADVTSQQNTSVWAKAGPMLRATTDPGSAYYAAFVTPGNGIAVQWRSTQGGASSQVLTSGATPSYLMVARFTVSGSPPTTLFTAYSSPDGVTWTAVPGSTVALNLTGTLLGGFALTSHSQGVGSAVTVQTLAVTPGEIPPPGLACPTGWSCADIGSPALMGQQTLQSGTWSVAGGGTDIWGTADSFHFVWQPLSADGSITARAVSQTSASAWAKAGLMLRATTDPGSPYYALFVTPSNGIVVQWRGTPGGGSAQVATTGAAPVFLRVTRSGATFSAATSPDGATWTSVPGSSLALSGLSGPALRGFAVTSHNAGKLSTTVFDTVSTTP